MSEKVLKNLTLDSNSSSSPPNQRGKKSKTRKPNKNRNRTRISARRIGGPNYQADFQMIKAARLAQEQNKKNNTSSGSNSRLKPMPMSMSQKNVTKNINTKVHSQGGTLPRVQELGGVSRTSSRMRLGSGKISRTKSRKSSNTSNMSGMEAAGSTAQREAIIRYGDLFKQGVVTVKWKKRFFLLTENRLLYFLESFDVPQDVLQIEISPKGEIDLNLIEDVRKDKNADNVFQIFTPSRTYKLRLEGKGEAARYSVSAWIASIRGAIENAKQQHHLHGNLRGSFSSYKIDEVEDAFLQANLFKHPAKRLINAETLYSVKDRNGPHQPAALEEYEDWTPFDVSAWLYTVHLQKYSEDFYQQQVDGKVLKKIVSEEDAVGVGVEESDLHQFMVAVNALREVKMIEELPLN